MYIYIHIYTHIAPVLFATVCIMWLQIHGHTHMLIYTPRQRGATWCYIRCFARDVCEQLASAVRCDMVLHRVIRARPI